MPGNSKTFERNENINTTTFLVWRNLHFITATMQKMFCLSCRKLEKGRLIDLQMYLCPNRKNIEDKQEFILSYKYEDVVMLRDYLSSVINLFDKLASCHSMTANVSVLLQVGYFIMSSPNCSSIIF
jgi:hypothetical protein